MISIFQREQNLKDIEPLFPISYVTDEYIVTKINNVTYHAYLFQIESIPLIHVNPNEEERIINQYKEFLKGLQDEIEIYIQDKEIKIEDYYQEISQDKKVIFEQYKKEINKNIKEKGIYLTEYYVVCKVEPGKSLPSLLSLKKNNNIIPIIGKENLKHVLYECVNKVQLYE